MGDDDRWKMLVVSWSADGWMLDQWILLVVNWVPVGGCRLIDNAHC